MDDFQAGLLLWALMLTALLMGALGVVAGWLRLRAVEDWLLGNIPNLLLVYFGVCFLGWVWSWVQLLCGD